MPFLSPNQQCHTTEFPLQLVLTTLGKMRWFVSEGTRQLNVTKCQSELRISAKNVVSKRLLHSHVIRVFMIKNPTKLSHQMYFKWKKDSEVMQTLRAGCSKREPKIIDPPLPLPGGAVWPKFNQLETVTTFTYRPSLVKIDACNFELSW